MNEETQITHVHIGSLIFNIRSEQVMLDSDLADMYDVELKRLNEQVKRNIERFPESFRFKLTKTELENLKSQFATSSSHGGRRTLPYAFTEQGVAMLSAVLRSEVAVKVSISIMNAFVQMRKTIGHHQQLLQLSSDFTKHKLETNEKFENIFKALEGPVIKNKQGVFFDGQTYDAYDFVNNLIKQAKKSIVLIDDYVDDTVITQLTRKLKNVEVYILSKTISKTLKLDIERANSQYPSFKAISFAKSHDRFMIIDQNEVYHIGASLKDLGRKWFAFSKLESDSISLKIVESIGDLVKDE